jgi:thioesterase domain-containing protein
MLDQPHCQALDARLRSMPPVRALSLRLDAYDGHNLRLRAPLADNINDKGSAFGGSLASAAMLASWGLTQLKLLEAGHAQADVYVQDSTLRYLAPLYDDLVAEAALAQDQGWDTFVAAFAQRGKARATLATELRCADGTVACRFEGRFVALLPRNAA